MALVVVQHLAPDKESILVELLQKSTIMPVVQIEDGVLVESGHIYVIAPNKNLSLRDGRLYLLDPPLARGPRMSIDYFLRSLADDVGPRAVGVILSGMGSDGTLGLKLIKENAGLVLVQDPATAKFDAMPRNAVDTGLVDIIAPVEELPRQLINCLALQSKMKGAEAGAETDAQKTALSRILSLLNAHTGQDFSLYKHATLYRRIDRRMSLHQIDKMVNYVPYLHENPSEIELLFKELLIGVTHFFRDPPVWECLKAQGLAAMLARSKDSRSLRAWVAGCSTGEEVYSLAIAFREVLDEVDPSGKITLKIFATDLNKDAIETGRRGWYLPNIATDVSPERLDRFFYEESGGYRVRKSIREMVVFAPHNLIMDPPFTHLDILICRNLLIYLEPELQKKLLPMFYYALKPGGLLLLGSAETAVNFSNLFTVIAAEQRLYHRTYSALRLTNLDLPMYRREQSFDPPGYRAKVSSNSLESSVERLLLSRFTPTAVLTNGEGDILYINGRSGTFLEPATGKANLNIHAMAREGLSQALDVALPRARSERKLVNVNGIRLHMNGADRFVNLSVYPLQEPESLQGMILILFTEVTAIPAPAEKKAHGKDDRLAELERALSAAHAEARSVREVMQSAQEESRSINEELQSTNEELTTSKEELQSLNEELQTVNAELQSKVDELSAANNDMMNLLNSTDIATIFLDNTLRIRRFTTHATDLFKLIPGDLGRPLSDIATALQQPSLENEAREVLRTLMFSERLIPTDDERWFIVKILPYRTSEDVIDGVVITFTDISAIKQLEEKLRRQEASR